MGQAKNDMVFEQVGLVTDRSVYCVTEWIHFTAFPQFLNETNETSKVLYLEFISPSGKAYLQKKYPFSIKGIIDSILIPAEIISGNYYLKAYTKWMRNFGPETYCYIPIKIINPYKEEILDATNFDLEVNYSIKKTGQININTRENEFTQNEKVKFQLTGLPNPDSVKLLTISVIHSGAKDSILEQVLLQNKKNKQDSITYLPETRGISLSGLVLNKEDSTPLPYSQVSLTILGESKKYLTTLADSNSNFIFSLPQMEGIIEVFISAKTNLKIADPLIFVENDFCTQEIQLPYIPFEIKKEQYPLINNVSINAQISNNFKGKTDTLSTIKINGEHPFYGKPTSEIILTDYIVMNNLDDYFKELITNVKLYKKEGQKKLRVEGVYSELSVYEPLVMVDFIPIYKTEAIMNISPKKVNRIEVVAKPYIIGNITYGGIIHIISNEHDFAGVSLPSTGQFFKIQNFETHLEMKDKVNKEDKIPNALNCLFWKVFTEWNNELTIPIEFKTGTSLGDFLIEVKCIKNNNEEIRSSKKISIKNGNY